jgi:tRNA (guanine37-N1)-methyltransferase
MKTFAIVSIFPNSLKNYLAESIIARAVRQKKVSFLLCNPRDFTTDKHHQVDDRPYGGGPGMVLKAEPILKAVNKIVGRKQKVKKIIFSPAGKQFTNQLAKKWLKQYDHFVLISGHYEGLDERVRKALQAEVVSIGPYVLTGGELPALIVIDTLCRQIDGVLGKPESLEEKRIASSEVYTRPETIKYNGHNFRVPKVLLSGHQAKIETWRRQRRTNNKN